MLINEFDDLMEAPHSGRFAFICRTDDRSE
jgi:hypothetical protein